MKLRNQLGIKLERALRRPVKSLIYKRLYGGAWHWWDSLLVAIYRRLPGCHPIVKATLEGK